MARGIHAQFMHELHNAIGGTMSTTSRIGLRYGVVYVATHLKLGGINLNSLYVNSSQRGLGLGEYMLRHFLVVADRLGVKVYLRALSYGTKKNRPDTAKLRRWYRRFGFHGIGGPWMVRLPKKPGVVRIIPRPRLRAARP